MPTLHVCLDEGGNLKFAPTGTKYYVFAVAWTFNPAPLATDLTCLRFSLLKQGHDIDSFHATEDKQANRDAVVQTLLRRGGWYFSAIVVEKRKVNLSIRDESVFYPKFAGMALRYVFKWANANGVTRVLAFTDQLPVAKHRQAVIKTFKTSCRQDLKAGTPFEIYHHKRQSNCWIQVADYCCWAVFKKWECGDTRTYDQLKPRLKVAELEVFRNSDGTVYY